MSNVILEIKNLRKVFTENLDEPLEVLKNINLEVREGEFVSLMGESGSRKINTTLSNRSA
jgi:ABC-type glutathione transport system ATPase component